MRNAGEDRVVPMFHSVMETANYISENDIHLLAEPFGEHPHGRLRRRVDRAARPDLVAGDGGDVDDLSALLTLHVREGGGDTVQHALEVHVNGAVPVIYLQALERRVRHQPSVIEHD